MAEGFELVVNNSNGKYGRFLVIDKNAYINNTVAKSLPLPYMLPSKMLLNHLLIRTPIGILNSWLQRI